MDDSITSMDFYTRDGRVIPLLPANNLAFKPQEKYTKQDIGEKEAIVGVYGYKGTKNHISAIGLILLPIKWAG